MPRGGLWMEYRIKRGAFKVPGIRLIRLIRLIAIIIIPVCSYWFSATVYIVIPINIAISCWSATNMLSIESCYTTPLTTLQSPRINPIHRIILDIYPVVTLRPQAHIGYNISSLDAVQPFHKIVVF